MIACMACGTLNRKGSRYCSNCGIQLEQATGLSCPYCSGQNALTYSYCQFCGAELLAGPERSAAPRTETSSTLPAPQSEASEHTDTVPHAHELTVDAQQEAASAAVPVPDGTLQAAAPPESPPARLGETVLDEPMAALTPPSPAGPAVEDASPSAPGVGSTVLPAAPPVSAQRAPASTERELPAWLYTGERSAQIVRAPDQSVHSRSAIGARRVPASGANRYLGDIQNTFVADRGWLSSSEEQRRESAPGASTASQTRKSIRPGCLAVALVPFATLCLLLSILTR
jgi:hypothetical protein